MSKQQKFESILAACALTAIFGYVESHAADRLPVGIYPIGDLPGGGTASSLVDLSNDGSTAVGSSPSFRTGSFSEPIRVTTSNLLTPSMHGLGLIPGGSHGQAVGVNSDGRVVAGWNRINTIGPEAFVWIDQDAGSPNLFPLGDFPGGMYFSRANAVSGDGSTVVGRGSSTSGSEAFIVRISNGQPGPMIGTSNVIGRLSTTEAHDVSGDGRVIVGFGWSEGQPQGFRWVSDGASGGHMVALGDFEGGDFRSNAFAVSSDGLSIAGLGRTAQGTEAALWRFGTDDELLSLQSLGDLAGGDTFSVAHGINADGSVVVGFSHTDLGPEAFVWKEATGMKRLQDVLICAGIDMSGWDYLEGAYGVSDDGMVIAGTGRRNGLQEGYIVVLPSGGSGAVGIGVLGLLGYRRRRSTA